jgi:hypothetical protein
MILRITLAGSIMGYPILKPKTIPKQKKAFKLVITDQDNLYIEHANGIGIVLPEK